MLINIKINSIIYLCFLLDKDSIQFNNKFVIRIQLYAINDSQNVESIELSFDSFSLYVFVCVYFHFMNNKKRLIFHKWIERLSKHSSYDRIALTFFFKRETHLQ